MRRLYASKLTKQDLLQSGITEITNDARVFRGDMEIFPHWIPGKRPYLGLTLYDLDEDGNRIKIPTVRLFKDRNVPTTTYLYKLRTLGLHRIMWAWHYGEVPEGMVVDHIDNKHETLYDYRLENLQLLTPQENLLKDIVYLRGDREIKCKMNKPRSYYEDKLLKYEEEYEKAKKEHNAKAAHKLRSNISQVRARLKYWDNHKEEYEKIININKEKKMKDQMKRDLAILKEYKRLAKENNDLEQWHQLCTVINNWKSYSEEVREEIINCVLWHAVCRYKV